MRIELSIPINHNDVSSLRIGDSVSLNGKILTARDKAHKYIYEKIIKNLHDPLDDELKAYLEYNLKNGVIYHCGPIMRREEGDYKVISAGPTTSIREEYYTSHLIKEFGVKAIIGKGGMGDHTLKALKDHKCVYLHAIGGTAVKTARWIKKVIDVKKLDFGIPEALWLLEVEGFIAYVTMDSHGGSLHDMVSIESRRIYESFEW